MKQANLFFINSYNKNTCLFNPQNDVIIKSALTELEYSVVEKKN